MKANELMIGDWLQHASGKCFLITRVDMWGDGSVHFACGHPYLWEYNNKFSPIPLTAEILEKNGFKIKEKWAQIGNFGNSPLIMWHFADDHILRHYKAELEVHQNDTGKVHVHIPCEYVHQLQHALRLCGIDKEIKL